jgi:hypothetical protein
MSSPKSRPIVARVPMRLKLMLKPGTPVRLCTVFVPELDTADELE